MADILQQAKDDYEDAREYVSEQYARIREDFRFSNPSCPEQWSEVAVKGRVGRPTHTLDRTNKYIQHVVNKHREAKTSADVIAVHGSADADVAERLKGIIRHIEYASKSDIAWDTASDHQARGGLGWVRVLPKLIHPETNEQELIIDRINEPTSCMLGAGWIAADGSDATCGFIETTVNDKLFERLYPKAKKDSFDTEGWFADDATRICEYFDVVETKATKLRIQGYGGMSLSKDEYTALSQKIGYEPKIDGEFDATSRVVNWYKLSGCEILETTVFPSQWIGLVPVLGHELWVEGKRYLCGLVRRLMDGQRLHNIEMSALTEALMVQPKAPFLVSVRALAGNEDAWAKLNSGNPNHLPYNDVDETGQPINAPTRLSPPNFPIAYANASNLAVQEMEEAVGMPRSTFGQQSNAVSGRAKLADQTAGETATFHFADNRRVAQEHVYRICIDAIPVVYKNAQQAKILGDDGKQSSVAIDSEMQTPTKMQGGKIVAINPGVGVYGVRVKIGPSYASIRDELGTKLQELGKGNPAMAAAMTPMLLELSDMPEEAKKITKVVMAMLPPEVQKAYTSEDTLSPQVTAQLEANAKQIQQMTAAMTQAHDVIKGLQGKLAEKSDEVQNHAKTAIAEIKTAKGELSAQASEVDHKRELLDKEAEIVKLKIQLAAAKTQANLTGQITEIAQVKKEFEDEMKFESEIKKATETQLGGAP